MATGDNIEVRSSSDVTIRENEREIIPKDMESIWNKMIKEIEFKTTEDKYPITRDKSTRTKHKSGDKSTKTEDKPTPPTMVFSVIGDLESNVSRSWPSSVFKKALIEATKSGGKTWILFHGTESEDSNVVREAYKNYKDEVKFSNKKNQWEMKLICLNRKQEEKMGDIEKEIYYIEEDMTDETLAEFEKHISQKKVFDEMPVPIAVLVCGGDIKTIIHIKRALKNKTPVIIMKGSGMAADFVFDSVFDIKHSSNIRSKKTRFLSECGVYGEQHSDQKTLDESIEWICNNKDMVSVFDLDLCDPLKLSNIVGETVIACWLLLDVDTEACRIAGIKDMPPKQPCNSTAVEFTGSLCRHQRKAAI